MKKRIIYESVLFTIKNKRVKEEIFGRSTEKGFLHDESRSETPKIAEKLLKKLKKQLC